VSAAGTVSGVAATAGGESTAGATSVSVIPTGVWQAARSLGEYSLVGCTVGPGFEFADFQFVSALPSHADHFSGDLAPFANLL
jgi:predicted cupin superfamily sugar epimerase